MICKLLLAACILVTFPAMAQGVKSPAKGPVKAEDTAIGSLMPHLVLWQYRDTAPNASATVEVAPAPKKDKKQLLEAARIKSEHLKPKLTNEDFSNGANLFVMMFNPACSHCEDVTLMLEKNIALFKKSKIILLANSVMGQFIPNFAGSFHIADYPAMYMGIDSSGFIDKTFLFRGLPQLNIYGRDHKLLKILISGDVEMDSLKRYIQ